MVMMEQGNVIKVMMDVDVEVAFEASRVKHVTGVCSAQEGVSAMNRVVWISIKSRTIILGGSSQNL